MTNLLVRMAGRAPVPVFVAEGHGAALEVARLRASHHMELVASPRHATIVLIVGRHGQSSEEPLALIHDQVPAPRVTAVLDSAVIPAAARVNGSIRVAIDEAVPALRKLNSEVLSGVRSESTLGPEENPVKWQGVGPFGTGGEGMMGGKPFGRPMAMTADGRDGLALDRLDLQFGPYLRGLPPGLTMRVGLQGDVCEEVEIRVAASVEHQAIERETAARLRVAALAELVAMAGLHGVARRVARLAVEPGLDSADLRGLRGTLDHRFGFRLATDGVGVIEVSDSEGDVTARWRRWIEEAAELLDGVSPELPGPVGLSELSTALVGMELGRVMLTLASLRLQLTTSQPNTVAS